MSDDEGGKPKKQILHRRSINKLEIVFDEKSRSDFIHGFRKRRKERQEYAKQQQVKRHREEKSQLRKQRHDLLDQKVKQVEAAKSRADRLYKHIQSTTEYENEENVITATVTPLFGSDSNSSSANSNKRKFNVENGHVFAIEEEEEGGGDTVEELKNLESRIQNVQPKTKPKRKPKRNEDGELLNKKKPRRGGGGSKHGGGKKRK